MTQKPGQRPVRSDSREVAELKQLRTIHPELATAIDLQVALLELQRRVQGRVAVPWIEVDPEWWKAQQQAGRPILRFEDIRLEWTDFRLVFRETVELLRRFETLEDLDYQRLRAMAREGVAIQPAVIAWYNRGTNESVSAQSAQQEDEALDQVLQLAMRPFLCRCAEAVLPRTDSSFWVHGRCPMCGGEPEFAVITQAADRLLICGRCAGRWRFDPLACPFCGNPDRDRITSFASRDGQYRIYACDQCQRYLKAFDERKSTRQVMVPVDSVATLPLDAAAIQKGYRS